MAVLREAMEVGITHIDTADCYGPHLTNQIIPGTSSVAHLRENVAGAALTLSDDDLTELDGMA
jgi:aryl-alcohol dehydrogenase-like predicted oxidoreductase